MANSAFNRHPAPASPAAPLLSREGTEAAIASQTPEQLAMGPVGLLIMAIARRKVDPARLSAARRQDCVHYLMHAGMPNADIARALGVTDRTITRDRQAIRRARALTLISDGPPNGPAEQDPQSAADSPAGWESEEDDLESGSTTTPAQLLGELESITLASIQRLTVLATSSKTPAYARLAAEEAIVRTYQKFITTADRLHALASRVTSSRPLLHRSSPRRDLTQAAATLLIAMESREEEPGQEEGMGRVIEMERLEGEG